MYLRLARVAHMPSPRDRQGQVTAYTMVLLHQRGYMPSFCQKNKEYSDRGPDAQGEETTLHTGSN